MHNYTYIPLGIAPISLHTILASFESKYKPQTVPKPLLMHTSNLPSYLVEPPTRRTSPSVQFTGIILFLAKHKRR